VLISTLIALTLASSDSPSFRTLPVRQLILPSPSKVQAPHVPGSEEDLHGEEEDLELAEIFSGARIPDEELATFVTRFSTLNVRPSGPTPLDGPVPTASAQKRSRDHGDEENQPSFNKKASPPLTEGGLIIH
jgi:hypothetical protein